MGTRKIFCRVTHCTTTIEVVLSVLAPLKRLPFFPTPPMFVFVRRTVERCGIPNLCRNELAAADVLLPYSTAVAASAWMMHGCFSRPLTPYAVCAVLLELVAMLPPEFEIDWVSDTVFGQLITISFLRLSAMMHGAIASEGSADSQSP